MHVGGVAGGSAAGAAAAAAAERRRQEEEEMTPYSREDLTEGWEFKFLRSGLGAFGKPERLREVLAEEARAGWALVEKFDDGRLRLKRPAGAKERDAALDFDPYRSSVPGEGKRVLRVLGVIAMISIVTAALVWFLLQSLR